MAAEFSEQTTKTDNLEELNGLISKILTRFNDAITSHLETHSKVLTFCDNLKEENKGLLERISTLKNEHEQLLIKLQKYNANKKTQHSLQDIEDPIISNGSNAKKLQDSNMELRSAYKDHSKDNSNLTPEQNILELNTIEQNTDLSLSHLKSLLRGKK